jgi:cytochrome b6-f complex iron-sulfur subunit
MAIAGSRLAGAAAGTTGATVAAELIGGGDAGTTRRRLLAWSGWGTIALVGLQAAVAGLAYFWPRRVAPVGIRVTAGAPEDYRVGDVRYFAEGKFYLVRLDEGFLALSQKCPHLGCTVPWKADLEEHGTRGLFKCPCHSSTYLPNGQIVAGPAKRPMDTMAIRLQGGKLLVDTAAITRRERWSPEQAFRIA